MRAIIIDDKDARALIDSLSLAATNKNLGSYGIEANEAWHSLPESTRTTIIDTIHRRFHYVVVCWLQDQGASTVR